MSIEKNKATNIASSNHNGNKNSDKSKVRKVINVSIQKKNFNELNNILNMWDEDELNLSSEVCKSILFKNELENNPIIQTLLSTLELIKTNLKNKDLFEYSEDEALNIALKYILAIKVNGCELSDFLANEFYFLDKSKINDNTKDMNNCEEQNIDTDENNNDNIKISEIKECEVTKIDESAQTIDSHNTDINKSNQSDIDNGNNINPTEVIKATDITPHNETVVYESINQVNNVLKWDIPNTPSFSKEDKNEDDSINSAFSGFSYP